MKHKLDDAYYRTCRLCPRDCGADRVRGQKGLCGETAECRIATVGPHFGEEPSFTGTNGSGAVFFSGCSCRCVFCQNYQISLNGKGRGTTTEELEQACLRMVEQGVHNLNFVTPDHFWPHIRELCQRLRQQNVDLPFLYNCSGYQRVELLDEIAQHMDIFMPDFKFADPALANECMGDRRYPDIAMAAVRRMVELKGFLAPWDDTGSVPAQHGVLVRHLVLPGHPDKSIALLENLHREFGAGLPLSVMSQFRANPACLQQGLFPEKLPMAEYEKVCATAERLGFDRVYIQPEAGDDEFRPDFEQEEPFPGNRRVKGC